MLIFIDSYYYQKNLLVPLNLVLYNVFGGDNKGPDLYGTEHWSFYFLNLLLNFNIVLVLAILAIPLLVILFL